MRRERCRDGEGGVMHKVMSCLIDSKDGWHEKSRSAAATDGEDSTAMERRAGEDDT